MKPFDLEAAKRGEPVWSNLHKKLVPFVGTLTNQELCVVVTDEKANVVLAVHRAYLKMAPKKRTVWVNFYPDTSAATRGFPWGDANWHTTKEKADELASGTRIGGKAWPLEIEE